MTVSNYNDNDKIAQRLAMLYTNVEAWLNLYYNLYILGYEDTLELRQSDDTSCLKDQTIPNLNKYLNDSVQHGTENPNRVYKGQVSELYINTKDKTIWICVKEGLEGWIQIFNSDTLETHNYDRNAHFDYIARINGNENTPFSVKNASDIGEFYDRISHYANTVVNRLYTGDIIKLETLSKSSIVDAINEVALFAEGINEIGGVLNKGVNNSMNSGNLEDGDIDIIDASTSASQENTIPGVYYTNMEAGSSATIELVGGGGGIAYRDGGVDEYGDTAWAWHYWHEGGGGAYFKGVFYTASAGVLKLITPSANGSGKGGDAIATFTPQGGFEVEVARAGGGAYGAPPVSWGFWASVSGGTVSYNSDYITQVIHSINGTSGNVYNHYFI